jgi:formate-dependent nitrite reductase cytochrome c552 subunit
MANDRRAFSAAVLLPVLWLALPAALGWMWIRAAGPAQVESTVASRPIQIPTNGYTSSDTCRACHPAQYDAWHRSYHRTMTQVATPETVVADFNNIRVDDVPGRPMVLERRGRELWADFDEPDWDGTGDAPPRIQRQVVMTTGSHHQQIYWYATGHGRLLGQLPAIRLTGENRWIPRRAAVMHPPDEALISESGSWNGICVQCHTTVGRPEFSTPFGSERLAAQTIDTKAVEFGIACEMCHGPADAHVAANASPMRRYMLHFKGGADSTIVQPTRLTAERSSEVCGQCHSLWEFYDRSGERVANSQGLPYRPGDELRSSRFVVQPTTNMAAPTMKTLLADDPQFVSDIFWSDGMVRATGREYNGLIDSPCYVKATDDSRKLSCASCHTMHQTADDIRPAAVWANDQLSPRADDTAPDGGNGACLACHQKFEGAALTAHTRHQANSAGSSCYNCHMPYTTYGLLKTIRSHQISSPSVTSTLDTGRPNSCNLCHLDKTLAWTAGRLQEWYGITPPADSRMADEDRNVAASLVSLLKGDAGQRAIIAQAMGWKPAQQASGTNWLPPYLAVLLNDPYDAVRFVAYRSIRSLPGYDGYTYDYVASESRRLTMQRQALQIWRDARRQQGRRTDAELLLTPDGSFIAATLDRLLSERNNRAVLWRE